MFISTTRERRSNAGNKMARLLNEEDTSAAAPSASTTSGHAPASGKSGDKIDSFYSQTYGGFLEEQEDNDYKSETSVEDSLDSDFEEDEDYEIVSDEADEKNSRGKPRKKRVVTRAYKEPSKNADKPKVPKKEPSSGKKFEPELVIYETKKLRASTQQKSLAVEKKQQADQRRQQTLKDMASRKNLSEVRRLTQEELMAEAKITAEINKRSLAQYQRLEFEKKRARAKKASAHESSIRLLSMSTRLLAEEPRVTAVTANVATGAVSSRPVALSLPERATRNFVSFTDNTAFRSVFPSNLRAQVGRYRERICPITGQQAKYFDPITLTPYRDVKAFRILRRLYATHQRTGEKAADLLLKFRKGQLTA